MSCVITYKGQSIPEEQFLQYLNKQIAINNLFNENKTLANQVYEALGFTGAISLESNLKNTGKTEQELIEYLQEKYPEIKLNISNNPIWEQGDNVFNQEEYNNQVNYRLKATEILLSDKAKQIFEKGKKNNWTLNKVLDEIGGFGNKTGYKNLFSEEQLNSNVKNLDREQLALDIASNYSYTVEINTAKQSLGKDVEYQYSIGKLDDGFGHITYGVYDPNNIMIGEYVTEKDAENHLKDIASKPAQYYSNLSAPGDTGRNKYEGNPDWEYQELEIFTPLITPNIKGHAQFATEHGIGWARVWYNKKTGVVEIQELQSDLFQKGRDKEQLTSKYEDTYSIENHGGSFWKLYSGGSEIYTSMDKEKVIAYKNELLKENKLPDNEFLQLLNKNNNWVTFFIKAIIQDSAKKGYKKVLFPKGETAAKIEGHETIADEIRKKDNEINALKPHYIIYIEGRTQNVKTIEEANQIVDTYNNIIDEDDPFSAKAYFKETEVTPDYKERIAKLEQEKANLKSQGIEKLKPIEAFYEIKVGNILEKLFGKDNVKTITDEYGNQWREITINQARDLKDILLQRNEANQIIGQANIKAMTVLIDAVNQKQDTLPHEYAHHYIAWFRDTPIVQEGIKRFGSEEALVQAIGEQVVKQKGEAYNWWKKFTNFIIKLLSDKQLLQVLTDSFLNRADLNDFTYNNISDEQKQQAQQLYSQYLDTIFPDSKVKDIVYHGTPKISKDNAYERLNLWEQYQDDLITEEEYNERIKQFPENPVIEKFDKSKIGSQSNSGLKKGFYFSTNKKVALWNESNNLYRAIVNSVNPQTIEGDGKKINFSKLKEATEKGDVVYKNTIDALENNTELLGDTIVVQEPEQIHILGSKQDVENFKDFVQGKHNNVKPEVEELFESNPKLANSVYEALGFKANIVQDNNSYYRGQYDEPIIDNNGNLILKAREDDLYKRAGLKSFGVSLTRDLKSAEEYGEGQLSVRQNLKEDELGYDRDTWEGERELSEITDNGYYLIQITDNISNEIIKESGEVKAINNVIVLKGKYKIQHISETIDEITPQQKQQAQQLYSQYLEQGDSKQGIEGFKNFVENDASFSVKRKTYQESLNTLEYRGLYVEDVEYLQDNKDIFLRVLHENKRERAWDITSDFIVKNLEAIMNNPNTFFNQSFKDKDVISYKEMSDVFKDSHVVAKVVEKYSKFLETYTIKRHFDETNGKDVRTGLGVFNVLSDKMVVSELNIFINVFLQKGYYNAYASSFNTVEEKKDFTRAFIKDVNREALETFAHESVHLVVGKQLRHDILQEEQNKEVSQEYRDLKALMEHSLRYLPHLKDIHGFSDIQEFVAEALTNGSFKKALLGVPASTEVNVSKYPPINFFKQLLDALVKYLSLSNITTFEESVLKQIMIVTDSLAEKSFENNLPSKINDLIALIEPTLEGVQSLENTGLINKMC